MNKIENILKYSKNLTILYVEDNLEARESTAMVLEEFFDNIIIAINGEDGYEKFLSNEIDIIITDINMPRMNGLEMVKKIKEINTNIPILVLSAYNESGFFIDSIKLGVEGYLLKPIDIEQFIEVISKAVQKIKLRIQAEKSENFLTQYKEITDKSSIVSIVNIDERLNYVNDAFIEMTGMHKDELIGKKYSDILYDKQSPEDFEKIWKFIRKEKKIWQGITKYISKNDKTFYFKTTIKPILNTNGKIVEYIATRNDITQIMNPKKQLNDFIKNTKYPILIYLKLDNYDILEELYENQIVELIQNEIAMYLSKAATSYCKSNKIFQLGDGEYTIASQREDFLFDNEKFINQIKEFQNIIQDHIVYAGDIKYAISIVVSVVFEGSQVIESAKIGIKKAIKTKQSLIISNNLAEEKLQSAQKNMATILMIKKAIDEYRIVPYFQPIVNNKTKKIEKYESLVRLIKENGEVLSPYHFLEIAKKSKYYSHITDIMVKSIFKALDKTDKVVTMNLSALDIERKNTREKILKYLERHKEQSNRIVFELLEDEGIKDMDILKTFIAKVKKFGVKIAIDDFGSGYSNFERLMDFSPDILKIDGSLVRNIAYNSYSLSVVKTIVTFAKEQNIETIAEFVETKEIFDILDYLGVDYSQGYYFGKPKKLDSDQ